MSRRQRVRRPLHTILLVCGGERTEVNYFDGMKSLERLKGVKVQLRPCPESPLRIVEYADRQREGYDECWCIFDKDEFESFEKANIEARRKGIKVAYSIPCFEIWYLLHYEGCMTPIMEARDALRRLQRHLPQYEKNLLEIYEILQPLQDAAIENGGTLKQQRKENNANSWPLTTVCKLVTRLRK